MDTTQHRTGAGHQGAAQGNAATYDHISIGPWEWDKQPKHVTLWSATQQRILSIREGVLPMMADERLLAAAPALLEACEASLQWFNGNPAVDHINIEQTYQMMVKLRNALRLAKGGAQ